MEALVSEGEPCADGVANHGERNPRADKKAVAAHEAAAVVEAEEGAPEFFGGSAAFAEPVAGGQAEHPDADEREEDEAGDPDVACDGAVMDAGEEKTARSSERRKRGWCRVVWAIEASGSGWFSDMTPTVTARMMTAIRVWVRNQKASRLSLAVVLSCEMSRSLAMATLAKVTPIE